ncbi:MAG: aldehyde dehydrogenase family protein, partial [Burkholderiales bacterium]
MKERLQRTVSPIDGSIYVERQLASGGQVENALEKAVAAQRAWKSVPVSERVKICRRMTSWCVERAEDLAQELTWQMGRPLAHSPFELRRGFAERATHMADIAEATLADVGVEPKENFQRFIRREPLGVTLIIAPWNFPWLTSVNAVVPALLAGNSVILKMAQQTPLVAERYAEAFKAAGLPPGVFQFVHIDHEQVAHVIQDERIAYVAFTGSVGGGHAVQRAAAERFIASGLELGGKDPAYIRADAELQPTIENVVDGAFFNAGQSCCAVERIYVHRDVYDDFVEGFVELTEQYRLGSPLDPETTLGPMVRIDAADNVRNQVHEAISMGAKALIDVARFPSAGQGTPYVAPQVLTNVDHRMRIMTEETFGPAVGIMRVEDDSEAVRLMNDS